VEKYKTPFREQRSLRMLFLLMISQEIYLGKRGMPACLGYTNEIVSVPKRYKIYNTR
jgi:hypothetical protein